MAGKKFHLGWFTNFCVDEWRTPMSAAGGNPWSGEFYVDFARALERACFDYLILEDKLMVSNVYGGSQDVYLKRAIKVPQHDPAPLAALIGGLTQHLGVVATLSTLGYHPFVLARLCGSLDHICKGRFGWNIVTSGEDLAAQNVGLDELPPRELRYDMADEYVELVNSLFASWDPDAVVRTPDAYVDPRKVRPINFVGKYYKSRGPLTTCPSPQGRPTYVQAGGSPRGRRFAAQHADSIIATANGAAGMKAYRDDVRQYAAKSGRNPDDIKVLFLAAPVLGETEDEAWAKYDRGLNAPGFVESSLAKYASFTEIDFSKYPLDEPLPRLTTNGEQGALDKFAQWGSGKTLRQLVKEGGTSSSLPLIGTPDQVADKMGEAMEAAGGDGYLITCPFTAINRRYITEITEGLVPALQRRGLVRTEYKGTTLREVLTEF